MNELTYICPSCDSDLIVKEADGENVTCPECKVKIKISFDADYVNGRYVDCTSLSIADQ